MKKLIFVLPLLFLLTTLVLPVMVSTVEAEGGVEEKAKAPAIDSGLREDIPDIGSPLEVIKTVANFMFWILVALTSVFIVYAGYLFIFSGGEPEKTAQARSYVIYAIVAIVVGMLARGLGNWVVEMMKRPS